MTETLPKPLPERALPAGNLATGALKLIALAFMIIDHSGKVLCGNMYEMRALGRIAYPLYVWCMIVGFSRTRSVPRYLLRLLVVGLLSQPLYVLALDNQRNVGLILQVLLAPLAEGFSFSGLWAVIYGILKKPNIFLSLLIGLAALWGVREKKYLSHIWAPALAICLATLLNADYGWRGIVFMLLLYAVQDTRPGIAAVMIAFFLFWGSTYSKTTVLFGVSTDLTSWPIFLSDPLNALMRMETYALLSLPLILVRFPRDIRLPKWISYGIYPAHLVLLILLKMLIPA